MYFKMKNEAGSHLRDDSRYFPRKAVANPGNSQGRATFSFQVERCNWELGEIERKRLKRLKTNSNPFRDRIRSFGDAQQTREYS